MNKINETQIDCGICHKPLLTVEDKTATGWAGVVHKSCLEVDYRQKANESQSVLERRERDKEIRAKAFHEIRAKLLNLRVPTAENTKVDIKQVCDVVDYLVNNL
jgi:hypothetical protein